MDLIIFIFELIVRFLVAVGRLIWWLSRSLFRIIVAALVYFKLIKPQLDQRKEFREKELGLKERELNLKERELNQRERPELEKRVEKELELEQARRLELEAELARVKELEIEVESEELSSRQPIAQLEQAQKLESEEEFTDETERRRQKLGEQ